MPNFTEPTVHDISWVRPISASSGFMGCDAAFGTMYLWRREYGIKICRYNDFVLRKYEYGGKISYGVPIGSGDFSDVITVLMEDAVSLGLDKLVLTGVDSDNAQRLAELYQDKVEFKEHRESADYIYLQSDLAQLSGRKYHGKRNHIAKFMRLYPNYSLEKITKQNIEAAREILRLWLSEGGRNADDFIGETRAVNDALDNFDTLGLFGALLTVDGKPAAMTIAEAINDELVDVHFEKALAEYQGAYTMLNREFAREYLSGFKLINREEDLGLEGLRRAKLSYHPLVLLDKSEAVIRL